MMLKKGKKILFGLLAGLMIFGTFSTNASAFISTVDEPLYIDDLTIEEIESIADELHINVDELIYLEENLEEAVLELEMSGDSNDLEETVIVQVSENLFLESSVEVEEETLLTRNTTTRRTVTSTQRLTNILGWTIITLNSTGVFTTNNTRVNIVDRFGSFTATGWNVTRPAGSQGGSGTTSAWVRNNFRGALRVGTSTVNLTFQTFERSNTITMNQRGGWSSSWR